MEKQEIFYWRVIGALFWVKNIKVPFVIGHPHLHIKPSIYVCRQVQGSQIFKQNWNISIRSRVIVILLIWVSSAVGCGAGAWGCLGWSTIVYMSSGMFRGKESSNRIKLSQLVQELLNFGVLGSLQLWVGTGGWWGGGGCPHTCAHAHTCMHTCTHTCKKLQMATNMFIMIVVSSPSSPSSPCLPRLPHVIPVISTSSVSSSHHPQTPI